MRRGIATGPLELGECAADVRMLDAPGEEATSLHHLVAGVVDGRRLVIDRADERDLVHDPRELREDLAHVDAAGDQVVELERATAREVDRLSEAGALEFENRMRAIREEAADRLREELDKTSETFLRRADLMIADQLQQAADAAAQRLDDRIIELARRFEASRSSAGV